MNDKRPVLIGENRPSADSPIMTRKGALRYARRIMPADLKRAGFVASVFASDAELHGGLWYRICYGKTVST